MEKFGHYILKGIVTLFFVTMLFSCHDRLDKVRKMNVTEFTPITVEKGVHLVYTDSGEMALKLRSPLLLDYSQLEFSYREFPEGLHLDFYDDQDKKNIVIADYAIIYTETNLVDLQGHVKIVTADSTILNCQQLYWDRSRHWLFTDQDYTIKMNNGTINSGSGFDANQKFDNFISRSNTGIHYIEDQKK